MLLTLFGCGMCGPCVVVAKCMVLGIVTLLVGACGSDLLVAVSIPRLFAPVQVKSTSYDVQLQLNT